jgi:hypothetical protein
VAPLSTVNSGVAGVLVSQDVRRASPRSTSKIDFFIYQLLRIEEVVKSPARAAGVFTSRQFTEIH